MPEQSARLPAPRNPGADFFADPSHTIRTAGGEALLSYDPAAQTALIFNIAEARWSIFTPCEFPRFLLMVAAAGYAIESGADSARWLAACDARAAPGAH